MAAVALAIFPSRGWAGVSPADGPTRDEAVETLKRATRFMVETVACKGGYVWAYLPDFSRRWGEMEAYPTMIWMQSPGTSAMGNVFLDAYRATKDEYYYEAAMQVAGALLRAQHPSGGWNYTADLDSEENLKRWYATIGHNGWRLEEFQHYYGNATFDDGTTAEAARFLLRLHQEKPDVKIQAALERAISFVLASQHASGGWPQRYPQTGVFSKEGWPDYSGCLTFNDGVSALNIEFLQACERALGGGRFAEPIRRGMNFFLITQQPAPQAGWALQYTDDLQPAGARSYEPKALATHITAANVGKLLDFYSQTGDKKYLARVPEALAWLDSVRLPSELARRGGAYPTFVELGTNRPLCIHRTGSNVTTGRYYADHDPQNTVGHYSSFRNVDVAALRARYERMLAVPPPAPAASSSANAPARGPGPRRGSANANTRAAQAIAALNAEGYWPTPLRTTSNPYKGDSPEVIPSGDYARSDVGDTYDTSPYAGSEAVNGITTSAYIANAGTLIRFIEANP